MGSDSTFAILKPTVKKDQTASVLEVTCIGKHDVLESMIWFVEFKVHFESRKIMSL